MSGDREDRLRAWWNSRSDYVSEKPPVVRYRVCNGPLHRGALVPEIKFARRRQTCRDCLKLKRYIMHREKISRRAREKELGE
jgi:hypothetical protein